MLNGIEESRNYDTNLREQRRGLLFGIGMIVLSLVFFESAVLFFLFPLPLALLYARKGEKWFLGGGACMIACVVVASLLKTRFLAGNDLPQATGSGVAVQQAIDVQVMHQLFFLEALVPFLILLGVFSAYTSLFRNLRKIYRLLIATLILAVVSIPLFRYFIANEGLKSLFENQMSIAAEAVRLSMTEPASFESSLFNAMFNTEKLLSYVYEAMQKSYLAMYFVLTAGTVWIADSIDRRLKGSIPRGFVAFAVPDPCIWALIASLAGVLADLFFGIGSVGYLFWNLGAIFLILYGCAGIGIISSLFERYKVRRGGRTLFWFLIIVLLLVPKVNFVCILGIPALGVSELWIKFREKT